MAVDDANIPKYEAAWKKALADEVSAEDEETLKEAEEAGWQPSS